MPVNITLKIGPLILKFSHLFILLFAVFGWMLSARIELLIHLIFIPAMILQWQFNEGTCWLTNWENKLQNRAEDKRQQQGQFIKTILSQFLDPLPSDRQIKFGIYSILAVSWLLSTLKLSQNLN